METRTKTIQSNKTQIGLLCEDITWASKTDTHNYRRIAQAITRNKSKKRKKPPQDLRTDGTMKVKIKEKRPEISAYELPSGTKGGEKFNIEWPDGRSFGITCPNDLHDCSKGTNIVAVAPGVDLPSILIPHNTVKGRNNKKGRTWSRVGAKYQAEILPRDSEDDGFLAPAGYVVSVMILLFF